MPKEVQGQNSPAWLPDKDAKVMQLWLPAAMHALAKRCARIERRTLGAFLATAVEEKIRRMLEDDIHSPDYVPVGLREGNRG